MTFSVKLDTRILDEIIRDAPGASNEAVGKITARASGYAKMFAPVDTGALMNSIDFENTRPGYWLLHDGVEYGVWQEFGTRRMAAHPFMTPAVEMVWNELLDPETYKKIFP